MNIKIKNLCKSFDKNPIIKDISMEINSGDIVCFLGPSGSGKTTLMRLILGAIKADKGEITIGDIKSPSFSLFPKIGYMPQNDALYNDLTAEENLRFFSGLYNMNTKQFNKAVDEVLAIVDLTEDKKKLVSKFSGGMKKRLSLAAAIIHKPDLLILDEPTVGIDPVLRRAIWQEFRKLKDEGKTLIVSTHVMDEITLCDSAALIYSGELIEFDEINNLKEKSPDGNIEELFFNSNIAKVGEGK